MKIKTDKIIKAIKNDATTKGAYYGTWDPSQMCVIAGLVEALPKSAERTRAKNVLKRNNQCAIDEKLELRRVAAFLTKKYGLDADQLRALQRINDRIDYTPTRRKQLIAKVKQLATQKGQHETKSTTKA